MAVTTALKKNLRSDLVSSLPGTPACSVVAQDSISQVVAKMNQCGVGCAMVVDEVDPRRLIGIFTEGDFLNRVVLAKLNVDAPIRQVMSNKPKVIDAGASILKAIEMMETQQVHHLPVLDGDGHLAAVLSLKDIIHYLVEYFPQAVYNLPPTPSLAQPAREGA